jgi:hypothetical protein
MLLDMMWMTKEELCSLLSEEDQDRGQRKTGRMRNHEEGGTCIMIMLMLKKKEMMAIAWQYHIIAII